MRVDALTDASSRPREVVAAPRQPSPVGAGGAIVKSAQATLPAVDDTRFELADVSRRVRTIAASLFVYVTMRDTRSRSALGTHD